MAVYVDDMYKSQMGQYRKMKMSHMIADTPKELNNMADRIGVALKWIQHEGQFNEHFDIAFSKRELAIKYGAIPITLKQLAMMCKNRRNHGVLGEPDPKWADAE